MCRRILASIGCISLLFCCSLPVSAASSEATEYVLTESQYNRLRNNLSRLSEINTTSQQELAALREQSINLSQKLEILKKNSAEQEKSLQIANEYLRKSKQEQLRVKWQRNIAWGILGFVLVSNLK